MNFSLSWTFSGVNHSLAGNGGPDCVRYLSMWRRGWETAAVCVLALGYIIWGFQRLYVPKHLTKNVEQRDRFGKRMLLVLMCLTFGCEIGFKLSNRSIIYLLNPCHVITMLQIYLLASPPHRYVTIVFRCHFHCLNGALLALIFPVLNTRMLPFEREVYFIQHIMMLVIPFYLLRVGGVYTVERFFDFSWTFMVLGVILLYHFLILHALGLLTQVNLNNMLCPAVSDPFRGPNYRICAVIHQSLLISILGKVYLAISWAILVLAGHTGAIHHPEEMPCCKSSSSSTPSNQRDVYASRSKKGEKIGDALDDTPFAKFWLRMSELWDDGGVGDGRPNGTPNAKCTNGHLDHND